jgi:oxygen-independent coproporphyrinogen-3 oxidase
MGPGAAGHVNGVRWKNIPRLSDYLRVGPMPPITNVEELDEDGRMGEILMLGLRLNEGISHDLLTGDREKIARRHVAAGLLEHCEGRVRFTRRGRLLADTVLAELL